MKILSKYYKNVFRNEADAHRLFFPAALIGAIFGVALWIHPGYPFAMRWHREVMIADFLIPAACGFSFIALPRFIGSIPTSLYDKLIMFVLWIVQMALVPFDLFTPFLFAKLGSLLYLAFYVTVRTVRRRGLIPVFFVFLPVALFSGVSGVLVQIADHFGIIDSSFAGPFASNAYFYGMFLLLVSGVGIKLFPILTQTSPTASPALPARWNQMLLSSKAFWSGVAVLLFASLAFPAAYDSPLFPGIRILILTLIAYGGWLLFRRSTRGGYLNFFLRVGVLLGIVGEVMTFLFPDAVSHMRHLVFIGMFGIPVFTVMTRVTLAHEGRPFDAELRSSWIVTIFLMLLIAAGLRVSAPYLDIYVIQLHAAAGFWISGAIAWGAFMAIQLISSIHPESSSTGGHQS